MLSLQYLIHGNHCYTLGISSNRKENVLASLSLAQKNMLCICLHIGHHAARKSLYETKVSRNWHELLWARKAPLKPSQKSCGKGQQLQWSELKGCLNVPSTVMGGRSHQTLLHRQHGGSIQNLRRPKMLLKEHPDHSGLQHIVCTGWCSSKTLQECVNNIDWPATKNTLPVTKKQLLPQKTGAQAIGCLFLKGNLRGEKILPRHTRKSCIRTGLIMWKGKSLSWQSYRALNQANYHCDKAAWLLQGGSHVSDGLY